MTLHLAAIVYVLFAFFLILCNLFPPLLKITKSNNVMGCCCKSFKTKMPLYFMEYVFLFFYERKPQEEVSKEEIMDVKMYWLFLNLKSRTITWVLNLMSPFRQKLQISADQHSIMIQITSRFYSCINQFEEMKEKIVYLNLIW